MQGRIGVRDKKLAQAIDLMRDHIEEPMPPAEVAGNSRYFPAPVRAFVCQTSGNITGTLLHVPAIGKGA